MKRIGTMLFVVGLAAGCGAGPLAHLRLQTFTESQRGLILSVAVPSLDAVEAAMASWKTGDADVARPRQLLLGLFGIPSAAIEGVATGRPVGVALSRADFRGSGGPIPMEVSAISFALDDPRAARAWMAQVGALEAHTDEFHRLRQSGGVEVGQGIFARRLSVSGGQLWIHADEEELIVSTTQLGLEVAGPAARAVRRISGDEVQVRVHPQVLSPAQRQRLAESLSRLLAYLKLGRDPRPGLRTPTGDRLAAIEVLSYLRPFTGAGLVTAGLTLDARGARLQVHADGPASTPVLQPALDRSLLGESAPAALGAIDCRQRLGPRQRTMMVAWRAGGNPGADELDHLVQVENDALAGSCSFAAWVDGETWTTAASFPLRPGASGDALAEALVAAIRAGGLPNLEGALDGLATARLLFEKGDGTTLSLSRMLGELESPETRHAAALFGAPVLRQRFAVRDERLVLTLGAQADRQLEKLTGPAADRPLPAMVEEALAGGRGKGGFVFLDLAALWTPYVRAAQAIRSPLADRLSQRPALLREPRPLVVTIEPTQELTATVTLAPRTFELVLGAGTYALTR